MYNPVTKAFRYLRREYPWESGFTGGLTLLGLAIAIPATIVSGGSLLIIPAVAGGAAGFGLFVSVMPPSFGDKPCGNSTYVNSVQVVGSQRDIRSVYSTQELIDSVTRKMTHLPELPPRTEKRILRHINDLQKRLPRLRVYGSGDQPAALSFTRKVIDAKGQEVTQVIATLTVPQAAREERAKLLPAVLESPGPLGLPAPQPAATMPTVTAEFGTLARKVEQIAGNVNDVEKRVGQLENPAPAQLDKPKPAKPA